MADDEPGGFLVQSLDPAADFVAPLRQLFDEQPQFGLQLVDRRLEFLPLLVVFFGLSLFYRLAPRRPTRFAEVWAAALCATVLLRVGEVLFVIYLNSFATFNVVYGAFGGIMALLLWIYLSGCVFIFGPCLCAGRASAVPLGGHHP